MNSNRRMVRYSEGALLYSMGLTCFQRLANEAEAVYRIEGMPPLVKCDVFEAYIERFREN
ncbi:DUF6462 family protein [Lachnospira multipara]|uniref:DUF6462 family protein n=1 Tax=Lachnospira multipara TaxID=28051 RepID=UPI000482D5F3|nr:DUF6462 family protein [Lachnospira multipara]